MRSLASSDPQNVPVIRSTLRVRGEAHVALKPVRGFGGEGWWDPCVLSEDHPAHHVEETSGCHGRYRGHSARPQGLPGHVLCLRDT